MQKKYIVIIAILTVLAVVVGVGGCVHNNSKSNQTENVSENKPIIINIPEEDKTESTVEKEEDVQSEVPEEREEDVQPKPPEEKEEDLQPESSSEPVAESTSVTVDESPDVSVSETKPEEKPVEEQVTQTPNISKVEVIPGQQRDPNNIVIVIDPGHQLRGDSNKEPNGPNSASMKARVTSGTTGVATGVAEYILNLDISLKLKTELENRGYVVHMTRSTHDVNISNKERAEYANSVNADIAVRIHANGGEASVHGAETYGPSASNPYVSHLSNASMNLSRHIIDAYCAATGFRNRGARTSDIMTGINWSSVPVTIVELGYMSNAEEDRAMQDETMQNNMVQGIANGIDAYFGM